MSATGMSGTSWNGAFHAFHGDAVELVVAQGPCPTRCLYPNRQFGACRVANTMLDRQ